MAGLTCFSEVTCTPCPSASRRLLGVVFMAARRLLLPVSSRAVRGCVGAWDQQSRNVNIRFIPSSCPPPLSSPPLYNARVTANGISGTGRNRSVRARGASVTQWGGNSQNRGSGLIIKGSRGQSLIYFTLRARLRVGQSSTCKELSSIASISKSYWFCHHNSMG